MNTLFTSILAIHVLPIALDAAKEKVARTRAEKPLLDFFLGELAFGLAEMTAAGVIGIHEEREVQEVAPRWFALHGDYAAPADDPVDDEPGDPVEPGA